MQLSEVWSLCQYLNIYWAYTIFTIIVSLLYIELLVLASASAKIEIIFTHIMWYMASNGILIWLIFHFPGSKGYSIALHVELAYD